MEEGDADTLYCYYAVIKLHWKPSEFAFLPHKERAAMYAFIDQRIEAEEREYKKIKNKTTRGGLR